MVRNTAASPPDEAAFDKVKRAAAGVPGVVEGTSYGTPALKVGKTLLCRVKDAETVVVACPVEEKELLMEAAPEFYFETDHYRGWPLMLVRVHSIPPDDLTRRLERAWLMHAPAKLVGSRGK
jgi:hypothetical protein